MNNNFFVKLKRSSHSFIHNIAASKIHRSLIKKFAIKLGMIYFGPVDQNIDEHRFLRGFTVSPTHKDNHYSVGSVEDYDVAIVDRNDVIIKPDGDTYVRGWLIMSFDLHTERDVPHMFINANNDNNSAYDLLFSTNPSLLEISLGTFEQYDPEFTRRFKIYSAPTDSIEVEKLLPAASARVLGVHLWPYSVEVCDNVLYVYSSDKNVTANTLKTMLLCGIWLAKNIDSLIESI